MYCAVCSIKTLKQTEFTSKISTFDSRQVEEIHEPRMGLQPRTGTPADGDPGGSNYVRNKLATTEHVKEIVAVVLVRIIKYSGGKTHPFSFCGTRFNLYQL